MDADNVATATGSGYPTERKQPLHRLPIAQIVVKEFHYRDVLASMRYWTRVQINSKKFRYACGWVAVIEAKISPAL